MGDAPTSLQSVVSVAGGAWAPGEVGLREPGPLGPKVQPYHLPQWRVGTSEGTVATENSNFARFFFIIYLPECEG